jgi:2-keto-4-pentenoate hydratase
MNHDQAAEALWRSIQGGAHDPAQLHGAIQSMDDAYRVQLGLLALFERAGDRQAGWKVGLTAKAMQAQHGYHEPVFGFLLQSGHRSSGVVLDFDALIRPGFENEICITLGEALEGPGVTFEQARRAVATVAPALEIIEKRHVARPDMKLTIADSAQQKAFVTGTAVPMGVLDLAVMTVEVAVNGVVQERALGAEVLGEGPIASLAWLANKLPQFGRRLEEGSRVMSGSFTKQYDVALGDTVEARFTSLGSVTAAFR